MASIFLSYDRQDAAKARRIAVSLERAGHSVWWDKHISGGSQYAKEIEDALNSADVVVVLWSASSVESPWVRDEAASGRDRARLVPLSLDGTAPPLGFRQFQSIDLGPWSGRGRAPRLKEILTAIECQSNNSGVPESSDKPRTPHRRGGPSPNMWAAIAVAIGMFSVVVGLLIGRPWEGKSSRVPTVAVRAADDSAESKDMARNLLVQLGRLQASNPDALELVSGSAAQGDLQLQVTASGSGKKSGATLALFASGDPAILWSRDYEQPNGRDADLREQLAFSAAQVLRCASQASGAKLRPGTRKLYLNGCAEFAQSSTDDIGGALSTFEQVTQEAAGFRDGWAKLLLSEATFASDPNPEVAQAHLASFRRHIAEAKRRFPDLPEVQLASIDLLPYNAYAERVRLADHAARAAPDNPYAHSYRGIELQRVGRMTEGLQDAELAARLDPLSPQLRDTSIMAMAYAGLPERANEELKKSERLWPGSWSVLATKFYFNLRYGDPAVALQILRQNGTGKMHEALLQASIDPRRGNVDRVLDMARAFLTQTHEIGSYVQVLAKFGREDEIYATLLSPETDYNLNGAEVFFRPNMKRFRDDPRFIQLAKRFGLVDYWRSSGKWPDFCLDPGLPYDCKAEAAKLK